MSNQIGTATGYPGYGYQVPVYPTAVRPLPGTNGLAIASLVISIHGLGVPGIGVVGAVLGHLACRRIAWSGEDGHGLAVAGIMIGWLSTALYALIIAAVVILVVLGSS
jgi:hypothetical protein